jgi:hypothetical protein
MSNGTISSVVGGVLSAKCTTDISKFPFDSQTCILDFTTWNIFSSDITFSLVPDSPVDLSFYGRNPDWVLQSYSARASIRITIKHIGFDVAGITSETKVRNIAYESKIVIESPMRSPDSTGRRKTSGLSKPNKIVGHTIIIL